MCWVSTHAAPGRGPGRTVAVTAGPSSPFLRRSIVNSASLRDAADVRAERAKLGFDLLVSAVDVVDALNRGLAFGDQGGDDQGGRRPQVAGHHGGAHQFLYARDDGRGAFLADVRAH